MLILIEPDKCVHGVYDPQPCKDCEQLLDQDICDQVQRTLEREMHWPHIPTYIPTPYADILRLPRNATEAYQSGIRIW